MAYACFTLTNFEGTEADDLYFVAFNERTGYDVDNCFDSFFGIFLCHFSFLSYCCDEFCFVHN